MDPSGSLSRNFWPSTASIILVAIPKVADSHIQKTAPGPPMAMAVATPAMLPLPTTVANEVVRA